MPEGPGRGSDGAPAAPDVPGARERAAYRYWTRDIVRFQDLDRLGHVNNVSFAVYLESGRVDFLETLNPGSTAGSGIGWVIARLVLDFVAEARYPADVDIGSRVLHIGRTSCVIGQGLFIGDRCFGAAENVCVWADTGAGRSRPMPEPVRAALADYLVPDAPRL
ncbi:acyl-CoA thioesterase [Roseospira marina]|nr:thioesterase family protein [Roseospira marina]MBB4313888.1 acyl-CoA thioester hydrolase [Roseospira marina]